MTSGFDAWGQNPLYFSLSNLHAGQPVNADCAACGVAPELDELLNGEDTSQVLDGSAVLSMAALEQPAGLGIPGDPADMGNADDVAVQVSLEDTGAAVIYTYVLVASGLDLGGLLQVLSMGVHLSQHSADSVVLHAQLLNPLLVIGACLVRDWHVLELSFLGEVDVVHCTGIGIYAGHLKSFSSQLSLS